MAKIPKNIVSEGAYLVSTGNGQRRLENITPQRLRHWAEQNRKMRAAGLKIPAPDKHVLEAKPEGDGKNKWSETAMGSKSNFGFWEDLDVIEDNGVAKLRGILDVPNTDDESKVGTTVQETSIFAVPEFVDGSGTVWNDVLTHIAVVTNPIEQGQDNFEKALALSMSNRLDEVMAMKLDDGGVQSHDLISMLEEVAGISIPENTSKDELEQALIAALKQKRLSDNQGNPSGSTNKRPNNSDLQEFPVIMSNNQQTIENLEAKVKSLEEALADVAGKDSATAMSQIQSQMNGTLNVIKDNKKQELRNRVDRLVNLGVLTGDDYIKQVREGVDNIQMSFDDNNVPSKTPVEYQIEALEKVNVPMPAKQPVMAMSERDAQGNYVVHEVPVDEGEDRELTDEESDSVIKRLLGKTS